MIGLACSACTHMEVFAPNKAPEYIVDKKTDFFRLGPQQAGAPDELPALTIFKVLKKEDMGYSEIELSDGRRGYVATEDIRVAPPLAPAVTHDTLFPPAVEPPLPEPDFRKPVSEIPLVSR